MSMSPATEIGFAEHALSADLEHVIALLTLHPEHAAQSLPTLADAADRLCDLVGAIQQSQAA